MQHAPDDRISHQQMSEELRNNPQSIRLVAMDGVVVLCEHRFKELSPQPVEFGKALTNVAVEFVECALLAAAFDYH